MALGAVVLLFFACKAGGLINALAGGATLIIFLAMLSVGLPAIAANASNAVAISPGHLSRQSQIARNYHRSHRASSYIPLSRYSVERWVRACSQSFSSGCSRCRCLRSSLSRQACSPLRSPFRHGLRVTSESLIRRPRLQRVFLGALTVMAVFFGHESVSC